MNSIEAVTSSQPSLIDRFYSDLLQHPKCAHFSEEQKKMIFQAGKIAEDFHKNEKRKVSGDPYITHPIALVCILLDSENTQGEKNKRRYPRYKSIIILLLHDALESHPERFEEIYDFAGMDIFCRVLKLSQLTSEYRIMIKDFLCEQLVSISKSKGRKFRYILYMLSHKSTQKEKILIGRFMNDKEAFEKLCNSYRTHLDTYCNKLSPEKKEKEIDGLWHYLFFDQFDAWHKVIDSINNLSDLKDMKEKEYYKLRRIPKLQALLFVLNKYEMTHEIDLLLQAWTSESVGGKEHQIIERRNEKLRFLLDYPSVLAQQMRIIQKITHGGVQTIQKITHGGVGIIQEKTRAIIKNFR